MYTLEYVACKSSSSEQLATGTLEECLSCSAEHSESTIKWTFHGWDEKYLSGESGLDYYLITRE